MPPYVKLAILFTKLAKEHGSKILHANNADLLTLDLGNALLKQKEILSNPAKSSLITSYELLPVILEVKILSTAVANKLGVDTKGKPAITVLEDIIAASDARGGNQAQGIKDTLEWTRDLFANPEIQDVLKMETTAIEKPANIKEIGKFAKQLFNRSRDEISRIDQFLKRAKNRKPPSKDGLTP